jgi:hypothetical protein
MKKEQVQYADVRELMQPGDIIAFGGKGEFSEIIKFATMGSVSHVGTILQTKIIDEASNRFFNNIIESTSLNGFSGVSVSRFSDRLHYDGEVWWLPLRQNLRATKFNKVVFFNFLFEQAEQHKEYDTVQAIKSALDALDKLPFGKHGPTYNQEDYTKFFCSELVAAGLKKAGLVTDINASEVTPIDLCRWSIYEDTYYQLKGDPTKDISRFNTLDPALWRV